ncbi:MAG: polysaccharide deacetylase family protein, partial [Treponema sp.]|nr:polysaccharide deacetylase family protein [Treponema sp.]
TGNASLIYINGDIVYRIQQNELFTRGLYSPLVGSGRIIARLPYDFDSVRDIFFCDVDGTQIVMIQDGSLVNYFSLGAQGYDYVHIKGIYSLTGLKGTPLDYRIFWTTERKPVLWIDMLGFSNSRKISSVYTLYGKMEHLLDINGCSSPVLSPDKRHIAFASGNSAYIYDTTSWMQCTRIQGEKIHSLAWTSAFSLAAGGEYTVRLWKFDFKNKTSEGRILYLSSAEKPFFDGNRISVYIKSLDKSFFYDEKKCMWIPSLAKPPATGSSMNGNFRVFTSSCRNPKFLNGIYVRSLSKKVVSYPVYRETEKNLPSPKRVAFAFDATDSAAGVAEILDTLERFGVKGTFFFNGEFIRRYPAETKQIALSGNNCASIFYSRADLLSKNFVIDADFIKRGLARNEDEFFITTGKELSLLWHAPFYKSSPLMKEASKEAGYTYVEALKNADDSVTFEDALAKKGEYKSSSELIEQITLSLKDRTVIPVNVGKAHGTRKDYLYENLDLLISSILDAGCEITDAALIAD